MRARVRGTLLEQHFLAEVVVILGLAVAVALPLRRLGVPMIIGYMVVGVAVGPHGLALLPESEITALAELGVVFLMFTVGLEFSVNRVVRLRRHVFGLGGAQVLMVTLAAALVLYLGSPGGFATALVAGGAFAMSSTAIGLKQLSSQAELNSRHGRSVLSILLFQDLATLVFIVVIPALAGGSEGPPVGVIERLARAAAAFMVLLALSRWLLRPIMDRIAAARSNELFMLTTLLVVLSGAYGAHLAGVSAPLGAFLVGMMLGETRYKHQVADDIRPFRDVLLGLFFVSIGMRLDPSVIPEHWLTVALVFIGIVVVKAALIVGLLRAFAVETVQAVRTGIVLGHGGEFGLLITTLALEVGIVGAAFGQPLLAGLILSMAIAPFLIRFNGAIARGLLPSRTVAPGPAAVKEALRDHVIICGYGSVGRHLASLLERNDVGLIAVDDDLDHVHDAEASGHGVLFGDAGRRTTLHAAGVERARCVVVTFGDVEVACRAITHARTLRSDLPVLASVEHQEAMQAVTDAGATEVIPEGLSASMLLGEHVLRVVGLDDTRAAKSVAELRAELEPAAG